MGVLWFLQILQAMLSAHTAADTPASAKARLKQLVMLQMVHLMVKGKPSYVVYSTINNIEED